MTYLDRLEPRRLLAFTTSVTSGVLTIQAGNAGSNLALSQSFDSLRVTDLNDGLSQDILLSLFTLVNVSGGNGNDRLTAAVITGKSFALNGGAGNDTLVASSGVVDYAGGSGTDFADFSAASQALVISLDGSANDTLLGVANRSVRADIENVAGGSGNDLISGTDGNNVLQGNGGKDTLLGNDGDDTLSGGNKNDSIVGGTGADFIVGGAGTMDIVSYVFSTRPVSISIDDIANDGPDRENDNIAATCEGFFGGSGDDLIIGSGKPNQIRGNGGNDTLRGGSGNDTIAGGPGLDSILGEAGNDVLDSADQQIDTVSGGSGIDTSNADVIDIVSTVP